MTSSRPRDAQELLWLLGDLRSEMEALAHLEQLKTEAIAARDLVALADITRSQEKLTLTLQGLERRRRALTDRMASPPPSAASSQQLEPTVEQVASTLPDAEGSALRRAGADLRDTVQRVKEITARNANLLLWAADLARATAQWLLGYGQVAPAYTRSGDREPEPALSARNWRA